VIHGTITRLVTHFSAVDGLFFAWQKGGNLPVHEGGSLVKQG
jgi:hypothetical protein